MNKTVRRAIKTSRANSEWYCVKNNRIHVTIPKEEIPTIPTTKDPKIKDENK